MRETAFLNRNLKITLTDERELEPRREEFRYEGGINDFVKYLVGTKDTVNSKPIYFEQAGEEGAVEVSLQWNTGYSETVLAFANNINTHEGGTHLDGFKNALTRTINEYARRNSILKEKDDNLSGEDIREGLVAVVSVKLRDPQFEGQTKTKLGNTEFRGFVQQVVTQGLAEFLEEHPKPARAIVTKSTQAAKARAAARKARELTRRKGLLESSTLPGQARRLLDTRRGVHGDLPRRGRLGGRLGQAGARPQLPGDPPAARQDPQRRACRSEPGAVQRGDPGDDLRVRDRRGRGVRHRTRRATTRRSS